MPSADVDSEGQYHPALAVQLKHVQEPAYGEYLPGMQPEHVSDIAIEVVPATQGVHVLAPALARVPA